MGNRAARLAGGLGWLGSMALHAAALCTALGVIPLGDAVSALQDRLRSEERKPAEAPKEPPAPPDDPAPPKKPESPPPREREPTPVRIPEPEPERDDTPSVTLGIDESTATDTETWLGFAEATAEHGGMPLGYEQAALTRAPGERASTLDLRAGLGASDLPASDRPASADADRAEEQGEGGAQDEMRDGAKPDPSSEAFVAASAIPTITLEREESVNAPGAGRVAAAAAESLERASELLEELKKRGGAGIASAPPGGARPIDETARADEKAPPLENPGAGGEEDAGGFLSDRDSDAAALAQAIAVNPGKPLAAKGLRIQTVRPKWSTYALATANPNDVAVRIWFDATGRVTKATVIQSSGRDDVDRPILDAVYMWRATGEHLAKIAAQPEGRVQLVFKIDLER